MRTRRGPDRTETWTRRRGILVAVVGASMMAGPVGAQPLQRTLFVGDFHPHPASSLRTVMDAGLPELQTCETVDPAISPDGGWVAFVAICDGEMDVWRVRTDGSEATRLTATAGKEHGPAWSPDGSRIAYAYADEGARSEIMVMARDGSESRAVTSNETTEWSPTWSPDGTRLAYESHREENADIYLLDLESGRETRLTTQSGRDVAPAWSPDGATIAFQTDRDGRYASTASTPMGLDHRTPSSCSTATP